MRVVADFEVEMGAGRPARGPDAGDALPLFDLRVLAHPVFGIVGIQGRQVIGVFDDDHEPVPGRSPATEHHFTVGGGPDGGAPGGADVDAVVMASVAAPERGGDRAPFQRPAEVVADRPNRGRFSRRPSSFAELGARLLRNLGRFVGRGHVHHPPGAGNPQSPPHLEVPGIANAVDPHQVPDVDPIGLGDAVQGLAGLHHVVDAFPPRAVPGDFGAETPGKNQGQAHPKNRRFEKQGAGHSSGLVVFITN